MPPDPLSFYLPYHQATHYWLVVFSPPGALQSTLAARGFAPHEDIVLKRVEGDWRAEWELLHAVLVLHAPACDVALIAGGDMPSSQECAMARKSFAALAALAESAWLGDVMLAGGITFFMQPVVDRRGKIFGHEALARAQKDGAPLSGRTIMEASRVLHAEHMLDRYLHVKALGEFVALDLNGALFINFKPGFIQHPEKYLEGMDEAVTSLGLVPRNIVLDFTHSGTQADAAQLRAVFEHCRARGYSLALDDIASPAIARKIFETIRPDFIKLDTALVRRVEERAAQQTIGELTRLAHAQGVLVLAEGVEQEEAHQTLLLLGIDLFQGYLFTASR